MLFSIKNDFLYTLLQAVIWFFHQLKRLSKNNSVPVNINVDDFDSEVKNGIISIVKNKTFIAPYDGTLYISVAKAGASSTAAVNIHIVEVNNLDDKPLCSILLNSAAGQSISASLIAGRKYKIYTHNAPDDSIPSVSTKVNRRNLALFLDLFWKIIFYKYEKVYLESKIIRW